MEKRTLGSTGLHCSVIGFGGAAISGEGRGYGFGKISEQQSLRLLQQSYEVGINLFDTAPIYGFGESERRMGKAFKGNNDVILLSKGGVTWDDNKRVDINNSPPVIQKMLEQSLRDLQRERLDIYLIHWPDSRHDIRFAMEVLVRAQEKEQIRYLGLSNTNADEIAKASEVAKIQVLQEEMNVFQTEKLEQHKTLIREKKLGFMSWGTFDKGILTGRVTAKRQFDREDCRSWAPWWKQQKKENKYIFVQKMKEKIGEENLAGWALKHNLDQPEVSLCLCGIRSEKQLNSLLKQM